MKRSLNVFGFHLPQVYVAAFAISGYSTATFRNRYKPFNPVLGETYECVREDRAFSFISEQVTRGENLSHNISFSRDLSRLASTCRSP